MKSFEGTLGVDDLATHVPHDFIVPPGTGTLAIRFTHAPEHPGEGEVPHQLSISVYGPDGARGTRHCNPDQSPVISREWASPGYTPGAIEPGEWRVEIDVHRILPPGGVDYRIEVACLPAETAPPAAPAIAAAPDAQARGPGWYRGDLHGHTLHSDAPMSVEEYLEHSISRGHDFVTLSDHNTVSGLPELNARAGAMPVIGAVELTTFHGHALVLGTREWQDWRVTDGRTMAQIARAQVTARRLFVIAHPMAVGHPWCTGCTWAYADVWPGPARHVEVWNGPWDEGVQNELGLRLFREWLSRGHRLVATSGTDVHAPYGPGAAIASIVIRAEELTEAALLEGLRRGHAYMTRGPGLRFSARGPDGAEAGMGDRVAAATATLAAGWSDAPDGAEVRLVIDGTEALTVQAGGDGELSHALETRRRSWAMLEIRDREDVMLAVSNPIFLGDWPVSGLEPGPD